jgi:uncharacterized protein (UPF0335 family)
MARPKKFRLTPDDVLDPQHARKLAGHVAEIEFVRSEVEKLQAQIAGIYDAADEDGFDKAIVRKTVARRAKPELEREAEQNAVENYALAVEKGIATRTREENLVDHDPITGEILGTTPHPVDHETVGRDAREPRPDVSSQPIQESPDATSSPLEDSGGCTSSAGTEGDKTGTPIQPETATTSTEQPIAAAEVTTPDANTHGQTGTAHHSGLAASGPANAEAVAKKVGQSEQEAAIELPVDTNLYAFTPKPLRPHCLRPLLCGGMGKDHCPSCQLAMAESERATA